MSDQDNNFDEYQLDLDMSAPIDWSSALQDLEKEAAPEVKKAQQKIQPVSESAPAPQRAESPKPPPPPQPAPEEPEEEKDLVADYTKILSSVNKAMDRLRKFRKAHPYLVAPNIFGHWEDSLKETSLMMTREYQRIRPRQDEGEGS